MAIPPPIVITGEQFITIYGDPAHNPRTSVGGFDSRNTFAFTGGFGRGNGQMLYDFGGRGGTEGPGSHQDAMDCFFSHAKVYGQNRNVAGTLDGVWWESVCPPIIWPSSSSGGATNTEGSTTPSAGIGNVGPSDGNEASAEIYYGFLNAKAPKANFSSTTNFPRTTPPTILGVTPVLNILEGPINAVPPTAMRVTFSYLAPGSFGVPPVNYYLSSGTDHAANSWDYDLHFPYTPPAIFDGRTPFTYGTWITTHSGPGETTTLDITPYINSSATYDICIECWTPDMLSSFFPSDMLGNGTKQRYASITMTTEVDYYFHYTWTYTFPDDGVLPGTVIPPLRQRQRDDGAGLDSKHARLDKTASSLQATRAPRLRQGGTYS